MISPTLIIVKNNKIFLRTLKLQTINSKINRFYDFQQKCINPNF